MCEKDKISIIVPIFNAEKYLKRCLDSLISQTYNNLEILLVNDGSNDSSLAICKEYEQIDNRIVVFDKNNEGVSKARNLGLKNAKGSYYMFVDADDWINNNMCETMLSFIKKTGSDVAICEYNEYYENEANFLEVKLPILNVGFASAITDDSNKYGGFAWNKMIKSDCIKKLFDENTHYYENLLFFLENFDNCTKYVVVHEPLYNYCINDGSAVHSKKYNIKKATELYSLSKILEKIPEDNLMLYKGIFINEYFFNKYYLDKINKKELYLQYADNVKENYLTVMNAPRVNLKLKMKMLVLYRFNFIYKVIKSLR